jgi:hypothetical protein
MLNVLKRNACPDIAAAAAAHAPNVGHTWGGGCCEYWSGGGTECVQGICTLLELLLR